MRRLPVGLAGVLVALTALGCVGSLTAPPEPSRAEAEAMAIEAAQSKIFLIRLVGAPTRVDVRRMTVGEYNARIGGLECVTADTPVWLAALRGDVRVRPPFNRPELRTDHMWVLLSADGWPLNYGGQEVDLAAAPSRTPAVPRFCTPRPLAPPGATVPVVGPTLTPAVPRG
jgi:hypothetical protein